MAQGGYRAPAKPAAVSGPGSLSRRTDGPGQPAAQLSNAAYGEQKDFQQIQGGAEMAGAPDLASLITPLSRETQRPNEPITAGAPMGPGPGPADVGILNMKQQSQQDALGLASFLPSLERTANSGNAPESFVRFVRYLRAQRNASL